MLAGTDCTPNSEYDSSCLLTDTGILEKIKASRGYSRKNHKYSVATPAQHRKAWWDRVLIFSYGILQIGTKLIWKFLKRCILYGQGTIEIE